MCEPATIMLAVAAATSAYGMEREHAAGEKATERGNAAAIEGYLQDLTVAQSQELEVAETHKMNQENANVEGRRKAAELEAANATISGSTINRISGSLAADEARTAMAEFEDYDRSIAQSARDRDALKRRAASRQRKGPDGRASALAIGGTLLGGAASSYGAYQDSRPPKTS